MSSQPKHYSSSELAAMLDDAIVKFGGITLPEPSREDLLHYTEEERWIPYLKSEYELYPNKQKALLGKGGYGAAYRCRSVKNKNEPVHVVKVIHKARVSTNAIQIQHACVEIVTAKMIEHKNLNHCVGLFHNKTTLFVILELCAGPQPDLLTRVAHIVANRKPSRIPEIPSIFQQCTQAAKEQGVDINDETALNDFADRTGLINKLAVECGVHLSREKPELPVSGDLFGHIVANKRLADPVTQVIARQTLIGLSVLHQHYIVHRDMKSENIIVGITRKAELIKDGASAESKVISVKFVDKYDVKVIDFGLVKYLNVNDTAFGQTVTPGGYVRGATAAVEENKKKAAGTTEEEDDGGFGAYNDEGGMDDILTGGSSGGNNNNNAGAGAGPQERFNACSVTPACTEIYAPFEVIHGILQNGVGRHKWSSSKTALPKVDVYGLGTVCFCTVNGRPPFRPPQSAAPMSREEKMRQIERQILVGPTFSSAASAQAKEFILKLMTHDAAMRPNADDALALPFVSHVGDTVITEINADGAKVCSLMKAPERTSTKQQVEQEESGDDDGGYTKEEQDADAAVEAAILAAARDREDDGDSAGKESLVEAKA